MPHGRDHEIRLIGGSVVEILEAIDSSVNLEGGRRVLVCAPTDSAMVLGSSQLDPGAGRAIGVARRHSGGGAVWIEPGGLTWIEVVLPGGDPLLHPDLGLSFGWLGRTVADAMGGLGHRATVHEGRSDPGPWGATVCFAGLSPGEVSVDGRKVVGLSQRRTRAWARFGVAVLHRFDPEPYRSVFDLPATAMDAIADRVGTVPRDGVVEALGAAIFD